MAWTTPRTWVTGEIVTASIMNVHVRDNLNWVCRPLYIKATQKDVVSTASAVDLLNSEVTVPGNSMGTKGALRVVLFGDYLNQTGSLRQFTLTVALGATTLYQDQSTTESSAANRHDWALELWIANQNSAASQFMLGLFHFSNQGGATTGVGDLSSTADGSDGPYEVPLGTNGTTAVDTTADQALTVTAQHTVSDAALSMRLKYAAVELIGQAA